MRYNWWSGYTSRLCENHLKATERDQRALKRVADESAPMLDRQQGALHSRARAQTARAQTSPTDPPWRWARQPPRRSARKVVQPDNTTLHILGQLGPVNTAHRRWQNASCRTSKAATASKARDEAFESYKPQQMLAVGPNVSDKEATK
eukprot:2638296-Rhodomonas_salina.2